jgi:hypothetical protein
MNINNLIEQTDKNMKNMYNMFSFIDTSPNNYSSINEYQENLPFLFSSFNTIIQSEDTTCNITSEEKFNYNSKLQQLENILNNCNENTNTSNKQECLYNNFNNDNVVNLINDLTNIVLKVDTLCMYRNIIPSQENEMCSNSNNILNSYSQDDIKKTSLFFAKYSSIIKNLKQIADNNIYDYLNKCGSDTKKLESYNRAQNVLANTLFQLGNINNTIQNIINNTSVENTHLNATTENTTQNMTQNMTQNTFNTCINNPEISERITDLNNQIRTLTTNNAILNNKLIKSNNDNNVNNDNNDKIFENFDNRWIYITFMSIFVIIIIVLIYVIMRRRKTTIISPYMNQ